MTAHARAHYPRKFFVIFRPQIFLEISPQNAARRSGANVVAWGVLSGEWMRRLEFVAALGGGR